MAESMDIFGDEGEDDDLGEEIARADPDEIAQRTRMVENEVKVLRNESARLSHEQQAQKEKIKENTEKIKPADLVGVNKDSYLILEALPAEFDSRVKAMEVDEKPTEQFNDVGGLEDQIQELIEAVV